MGLAAWASYGLLFKVTHSSNLSLMVALVVAVVVYFALLLSLGTLTREDMSLMPKGDKLSRLLHIK
jgi:stage V sporulation protein B